MTAREPSCISSAAGSKPRLPYAPTGSQLGFGPIAAPRRAEGRRLAPLWGSNQNGPGFNLGPYSGPKNDGWPAPPPFRGGPRGGSSSLRRVPRGDGKQENPSPEDGREVAGGGGGGGGQRCAWGGWGLLGAPRESFAAARVGRSLHRVIEEHVGDVERID